MTGSKYQIISNGEIEIDGTRIFLDHAGNDALFRGKGRTDAVYMAKPLGYLESYDELSVSGAVPRDKLLNLLEIGIFEGGSAIYFDKYFALRRMACVDFMPTPAPALEQYVRSGASTRIRTHYGVDQADRQAMRTILEADFDGPIDMVVDDASHWYEQSKASFEAVFPYVAEGGIYIIEDWTWAHAESFAAPDHPWAHVPALSNLVFRLIMAHASGAGIISKIGISTGLMWVKKGPKVLDKAGFSLDEFEHPRGKTLSLI